MVSQKFTTENTHQTQKLAERFAKRLKGGDVLALYGQLGSGKTTFIQGLARGLGIKKRILSPSFTLIRPYAIPHRPYALYHIDLYRLNSLQEAEGLGLEEVFADKNAIVAIEWAEKIKEILPAKRWDIYFEYENDGRRRITIFRNNFSLRSQGDLRKAIEILNQGGVVVSPTDTAFGVGCRIDDEKAVGRLVKLKRRPQNQAMPVLVDSLKMAQKYLLPFEDRVLELIKKYWPGALTIVLPCRVELIPQSVRGGGKTLGVRWPNHPVAQKLITETGVPILGPSANFPGAKTPYKYEDLDPEFLKNVDYVLPGECPVGIASTVIDCSQKPWKIIRQGAIHLSIK